MEEFTCLGSKIDRLGGIDADVKARIGKARTDVTSLKFIRILKTYLKNII